MNIFKTMPLMAALISLFAFVTIAHAEPGQGVLETCESDIARFCKQVTPGNGHIIACMYAHEDQIGEQCAAAIVDFGDILDNLFFTVRQALAICAPDIKAHCAGTQIGSGRILTCLNEAENVSDECTAAASAFVSTLAYE